MSSIIPGRRVKELHKDLLSLHKQSYLQNTENIPNYYGYRVEVFTKNSYNSMAISIKETLAHLSIKQFVHREVTPKKETDINMLECIQEFIQLKELHWACITDKFFYD